MKDSKLAWSVRPLHSQDRDAILALFERVFGGKLPADHWDWLFPGNPFSRPIVYLAETPEGQIVGHYSLIPIPFRRGGKQVLAALSIQSMIHPDFQRQGILKALARAAENQLQEDGIAMGVTFLNDNSLHAYTNHFGWTKLQGGCPIHFAVLDARGPILKVLRFDLLARVLSPLVNCANALLCPGRKTVVAEVAIREAQAFDSRVDELWQAFSRGIGNTVERGARYLNWRISDKPANYGILFAESRQALLGLVVTKTEKKFGLEFGYVVELIHDPTRPDVAEMLLAAALAKLREQGCSMATALAVGPVSISRALRRCGFRRLPSAAMPHGIHFCFKDRTLPALDFSVSSWFLSWSDHDVV